MSEIRNKRLEFVRQILARHGAGVVHPTKEMAERWAVQRNATLAPVDPNAVGQSPGRRCLEVLPNLPPMDRPIAGDPGAERMYVYVSTGMLPASQVPELITFFDSIATQAALAATYFGDAQQSPGAEVPIGEKKAKDLLAEKCGCIFCGKPIELTSVGREQPEDYAARVNAIARSHYQTCPSNPLVQALTFYADSGIYKRKKADSEYTIARQDCGATAKNALGGKVLPLSAVAERRLLKKKEKKLEEVPQHGSGPRPSGRA